MQFFMANRFSLLPGPKFGQHSKFAPVLVWDLFWGDLFLGRGVHSTRAAFFRLKRQGIVEHMGLGRLNQHSTLKIQNSNEPTLVPAPTPGIILPECGSE